MSHYLALIPLAMLVVGIVLGVRNPKDGQRRRQQMNNPTWSVYTVEQERPTSFAIVKTVWNQGGPTSLRKVVGRLTDATFEEASEAAALAQRTYDNIRLGMDPK